ncbi:MAG: hypothetical protein JRN15_21690 [Nitrososphaerota archaeon]|nr:hypothetical protein [Nitrososphaerota archaeon]
MNKWIEWVLSLTIGLIGILWLGIGLALTLSPYGSPKAGLSIMAGGLVIYVVGRCTRD